MEWGQEWYGNKSVEWGWGRWEWEWEFGIEMQIGVVQK